MRILLGLVLVVGVLCGIGGCASSNYLLAEPQVFKACLSDDPGGRDLSFDILLETVRHQNGWILERISKEKYELDVRVCRGSFCIPLLASVETDGRVLWRRDPVVPIDNNWAEELHRWLNRLEEGYAKRRCAKELKK
ncbi:MAG: hypothetical protein A2511_18060 [Deltaproteobacteria bacterium RIFOXYD12_FULL_50_9]|nr:MAG: hypothetical protein A2511_18060 [Deltaproteobacteria bacterium RIFOXYD12_FULL_50_9]